MKLRWPARFLLLSLISYSVLISTLCSSDSQACFECRPGTYADSNNSCCGESVCSSPGECEQERNCTPCPLGYNATDRGSTKCMPCGPGSFANTTGSSNCTLCEPGTYSNETARTTSCTLCEPGYNASQPGSIVCGRCPVGTVASVSGSETCHVCSAGKAPNENSTECSPCSRGYNASQPGSPSCKPCPKGTYSNFTQTKFCTPCVPGTAANTTGTKECALCMPGRYSSRNGSANCSVCEYGLVCNHTGCTECLPCGGGEEPQPGFSHCGQCKAGTYRPEGFSKHFCQPCESGFYQVHTGQLKCDECPRDYYCPDPSSYPKVCPRGAHCPNGSVKPIFCKTLYSYNDSKQKCVPEATFYVTIVCAVAFFILMILLVAGAVYWNLCRKKQKVEEKVPLVQKGPVKEPQYTGL